MPRPLSLLIALLAGLAAALVLAACGSGGDRSALIPSSDADTLRDRIGAVEDALEEGECEALPQDLQSLREALGALPSTVDPELRAELERGVDRVVSDAPEQCEEPEETETTETTETTAPTETTSTETTETTPTETAPPTTTQQIPTTTTPVPPTTPDPTSPGGVESPGSGTGGGVPADPGEVTP